MKFGRDFKESLANEGFPPHWVDHAIPYRQLKKCLRKIERELSDLGLDAPTIRALLDSSSDAPIALQYRLDTSAESQNIRPKLTVYVHLKDGEIVDASLTPASRRFVEKVARGFSHEDDSSAVEGNSEHAMPVEEAEPNADESFTPEKGIKMVELPLVFDNEFFEKLQNEVSNLDALQAEEEKNLTSEVVQLGKEVTELSRPSRFSKSDLSRWRAIFELYLDAEVFFATHEQNHGANSSKSALKQLQWFQGEVRSRGLASNFKLPESEKAFTRFLQLNASILQNLQFQELNRLAVSKILKKFDKRTSFGVSKHFPIAIQSDKLLTGSVAKDVCAEMSKELVAVVPQLNDYLCPVCFSVAYKPIRLACQHVFCIRCIVKIQRRKEKHCPLCRAEVVMKVTDESLDDQLDKYLRKYFPKEVKEKQRANDIERGIEDFGPGYTHHECMIM